TTQSGSDRIYYLKSAVALWARAPLWGSGAGTYGDLHPQVQQRVVSASVSAHNFYVQTLAELGIVGGLLLIAVLLALMAGLVRGWWRAGELGAPLVLSVVALLIHFGLDMDQRYPAVVVLLAVIVGLVYSQSKETERRIGWPTLALAVLLLPVAISLFMSNTAYHRGQASLSNGDYQEATDEFASASQWPVYDPDAVGAEAIGWFSQGALQPANRAADLALALDRARAAIRQDPTDSQHRQIEARVLALQNDLPGAEAALREALRLDPYNHPDYAWDLSNVYLRMNRPEDAVAVARAMLAQYPISVISNRWVDPSVPVFVGNLWAVVGNVALAKGDLVEARADAIQALTVDRTNLRGRALQVQIDRQR
ncbi:MAG TPA: O-antigen ligase family protein, partial [Candidatus Saccharimonas sp.]|nr:O-antigen ligase family protein [Candidatus Saccharimonas sp.]